MPGIPEIISPTVTHRKLGREIEQKEFAGIPPPRTIKYQKQFQNTLVVH